MEEKKFDIKEIDQYMAGSISNLNDMDWFDAANAPFQISGLYWFSKDKAYQRLPLSKLPSLSSPLQKLSRCMAGAQLRFRSNSTRIAIRTCLPDCTLSAKQAFLGQCGFDLYVDGIYWDGINNTQLDTPMECELYHADAGEMHDFIINFPLYNGVKWLCIGLDKDASIAPPAPWSIPQPIVIYGTSITQGGCASRPGMAFTNILSRRLNAEFLNFGFSGMGKNDAEIAEILATIENPAMYIIDSEANSVSSELIVQRVPVFLDILRKKHPTTPIMVLSKITYGPRYSRELPILKDDFRKIVQQRQDSGDKYITFVDGTDFLKDDIYHECSMDGAHPNDLGFHYMAKALLPILQQMLHTIHCN